MIKRLKYLCKLFYLCRHVQRRCVCVCFFSGRLVLYRRHVSLVNSVWLGLIPAPQASHSRSNLASNITYFKKFLLTMWHVVNEKW